MRKGKIYISGPIAGLDHAVALERFFECEKFVIRQTEFIPINPAQYIYERIITGEIPGSAEWKFYMKITISLMMDADCNSIIFLPGWTESKGAMIEAILALQLGYEMYNFFTFENKKTITRMR